MKNASLSLIGVAIVTMVVSSCGSLAPTASVRDDVYFLPSQAPLTASMDGGAPDVSSTPAPTDDYYDPQTSQQMGADRNYYDLTYNDPYYYNYGRFGFNNFGNSMAFQPNLYMGAYGNSMAWGFGTGVYSGWYRPGFSGSCSPFGGINGWDQFAWYNDPFYNNGWGSPYGFGGYNGYGSCGYGFGGGYGYGNYYSPYGNCYSCYTPVVTGDAGYGTMVGHRPSTRGGGSMSNVGLNRPVRNTVGLMPAPRGTNGVRYQGDARTRTQPTAPSIDRDPVRPSRSANERTRPSIDPSRSAPGRSVFDGSRSSPSPSIGGGGGSRGGGGGGGTRSSPGRR